MGRELSADRVCADTNFFIEWRGTCAPPCRLIRGLRVRGLSRGLLLYELGERGFSRIPGRKKPGPRSFLKDSIR